MTDLANVSGSLMRKVLPSSDHDAISVSHVVIISNASVGYSLVCGVVVCSVVD